MSVTRRLTLNSVMKSIQGVQTVFVLISTAHGLSANDTPQHTPHPQKVMAFQWWNAQPRLLAPMFLHLPLALK